MAIFGIIGLLGGVGYTAPPLRLKYRGLGLPVVFVLMGPPMVEGAFYVVTGHVSLAAFAVSIPIGCLVAAILHGNEWRDIALTKATASTCPRNGLRGHVPRRSSRRCGRADQGKRHYHSGPGVGAS